MRTGQYKHYKGNLYVVLGVGKNSETLEDFVVYQAKYDGPFGYDAIWVRPLAMFNSEVEVNGQKVPRFEYVEGQDNPDEWDV